MASATPHKILIIDDDPFVREMYAFRFEKEPDFEIETATDGREGLERIRAFQPDVVLLDLVLPRLDGYEVLAELQKEPSAHPPKIIVLSNLGQREEVDRGLKLGAVEYVIKARFTPTEVLKKVRALLPG